MEYAADRNEGAVALSTPGPDRDEGELRNAPGALQRLEDALRLVGHDGRPGEQVPQVGEARRDVAPALVVRGGARVRAGDDVDARKRGGALLVLLGNTLAVVVV